MTWATIRLKDGTVVEGRYEFEDEEAFSLITARARTKVPKELVEFIRKEG